MSCYFRVVMVLNRLKHFRGEEVATFNDVIWKLSLMYYHHDFSRNYFNVEK